MHFRFYLPHEMVLSRIERASVHSNEIFLTESTDDIDVETIQMKATIFLTKGIVSIYCYTYNFFCQLSQSGILLVLCYSMFEIIFVASPQNDSSTLDDIETKIQSIQEYSGAP